jgi:hypothetical protein
MLVIPTELRPSPIHGIGLFLLVPLKKGEPVWHFDSRVDRLYSESEIEQFINAYACWNKDTRLWMLCGDNMRYCNHSDNPTLFLSTGGLGPDSAACDLAIGDELTANYYLACDRASLTGEF